MDNVILKVMVSVLIDFRLGIPESVPNLERFFALPFLFQILPNIGFYCKRQHAPSLGTRYLSLFELLSLYDLPDKMKDEMKRREHCSHPRNQREALSLGTSLAFPQSLILISLSNKIPD